MNGTHNDDGEVMPRRTRGRRFPGGVRTLEDRQKEWRREEEEWAARSGPVVIKRKAKT